MHAQTYSYYRNIFNGQRFPLAFLDRDALDANIQSIVSRAFPKKIRIATKSIRCVKALEYILSSNSQAFCGLMAFRADEAIELANLGFDDILIGYPVVNAPMLEALAGIAAQGRRITLMVDSEKQVQLLAGIAERYGVVLPLCLDVDMSVDFPGLHFGVWRSPVQSPEQVKKLAQAIKQYPQLTLEGLMGYEAQIAGLADNMPGSGLKNQAIRLLKRLSVAKVAERRRKAVDTLQQMGFTLRFVNAGGTGSLEQSALEPWVSEVTAGSGFFQSHLFDYYTHFLHRPAAGFALEITRIPQQHKYTCFGGGYIASGATGGEKQPLPWLPANCKLTAQEGAGEVQTPINYKGDQVLDIGDPIFFRHAKAGELCEHFDSLFIVSNGKIVDQWSTYRTLRR